MQLIGVYVVLAIIGAFVSFFLGRIVARALFRGFDRAMETSRLDVSLRQFLHDVWALTMPYWFSSKRTRGLVLLASLSHLCCDCTPRSWDSDSPARSRAAACA